jgi:hypothetical protein
MVAITDAVRCPKMSENVRFGMIESLRVVQFAGLMISGLATSDMARRAIESLSQFDSRHRIE